ncbi:MAG: DUF2029 domain-containing protein, partial [Chloroflexota bacterium]|nr:DUF2029 domain-containing protein [Chloroflexota bacterium]
MNIAGQNRLDEAGRAATAVRPGPLSALLRGGRLPLYVALCLVLLLFARSASSWAQFFTAPSEANGNRVVLFTQADYPAVVIASRLAAGRHGGELYDLHTQLVEQERLVREGYLALAPGADLKYPYPYAPFIAMLMSPFSALSPLHQMALWDLLNIAGMAVGLAYLLWSMPLPAAARGLLLLGGLSSFPFIVNLEQGQSSGIVALGLGLGIALLSKGHEGRGGLALGLLLLKVQWLPFIVLVLLWKRRWRALGGMALTGAVLLSATTLLLGTSWLPGYFTMFERAQAFSRELMLDPYYSHSLTGLLAGVLGNGHDALIRIANSAALAAFALLLLYLWRRKWKPGSPGWQGLMSATLLTTMLTNVMLNTHDLSLLVLPGALGLSYLYNAAGSQRRLIACWGALLWGGYIITSLVSPGQLLAMPVR